MPEDKEKADKALELAAIRSASQVVYEARFTAISTYYNNVLYTPMPKEKAKQDKVTLTKEQYMDVSRTMFLFPVGAKFIVWSSSEVCFHYVGDSWLVLWKEGRMGEVH